MGDEKILDKVDILSSKIEVKKKVQKRMKPKTRK